MIPFPNLKHKDRLFVFLFGNERYKQFTLSLYNAINNTDYDDPDLITFNTLDNFLYMGIKNNVSFVIADTINLYEHQSTLNGNMPLRMLLYVSRIYSSLIDELGDSIYYNKPLKLPGPSFVVFYNGEQDIGESKTQMISDILSEVNGIKLEMYVRILNINYGHNRWLMDKCPPLKEYSWFVYEIRKIRNKTGDLSKAIADAIMNMPDSFVIKPIILKHTTEVSEMIFTIENYEKDMRKYFDTVKRYATEEGLIEGRQAGIEEGIKEDIKKGIKEGRQAGIKEGIKKGYADGINESKEKTIELMIELGYSKEDAIKMVEGKFKQDTKEL